MSGINKVILVGHLGKDPEVKTIESGVKVAKFSLATTETYKDKSGERKDVTEWHNITCWRNLAEIAEKYLTKGKQIYVEGKIRSRSWEDNGVKKYATDIVADSFTMLGSKSDANDNAGKFPTNEPQGQSINEPELPPFMAEEEDLPF
ncbi:MAG: single-stranded DNA-binding protein [Bacteroidales bacterium]|nr:single-stranded DNA-binding protein [Bacteroidales bacterium]MDD4209005.1 single-stranded DNA-binding protein [Bacteroidales bacterium]